jgi:hypothetical protein
MDISQKAMLVSLHVSRWGGTLTDKSVTEEVATSHHAERSTAGRYQKNLVDPKHPLARKIIKIRSTAYSYFYHNSLPWAKTGARAVTNVIYPEFRSTLRRMQSEFEAAADEYCAELPDMFKQAQTSLGSMFNAADYPDPRTIRELFSFALEVVPVPSANDFRVDMSKEAVAEVKREMAERHDRMMEAANKDIWKRSRDHVAKMAERLKKFDPANPRKAPFRDTLVTNIEDVIELMAKLNIAEDKDMETFRQEIANELVTHDPNTLRHDTRKRNETKRKAAQIAKRMDAYI